MCEISSASIAFGSAQRYYTVQQLIAQLSLALCETTVKRGRINGGELILSLIYLCNCCIIYKTDIDNTDSRLVWLDIFMSPMYFVRRTSKNIKTISL